jgi:hypothetical protein
MMLQRGQVPACIGMHLVVLLLSLMCIGRSLQLMASNPPPTTDAKELAEKQQLVRSQLLRTNLGFLPESAFRERRHYFTNKVSCWAEQTTCARQQEA